jgi:hypothetical protein
MKDSILRATELIKRVGKIKTEINIDQSREKMFAGIRRIFDKGIPVERSNGIASVKPEDLVEAVRESFDEISRLNDKEEED